MMTRWHDDDLAGRILKEAKKTGEPWLVVNLPAIAEEGDLLNRKPGEPLWPDRFSLETLHGIKEAVGPEWWSALYQQRPRIQRGMLFKRQFFRYFEPDGDLYKLHDGADNSKNVNARDCWIFQTCDPAASTSTTADYFVLATWAVTRDNDLLLLDILRDRLEGPDQPKLFKQAYDRWHPKFQAVESTGLGKTLFQMLVREGLPEYEDESEPFIIGI